MSNGGKTGQVKIGHEFFAKIKNDYADWRWALVREFLQNCIDAPGCGRVEVRLTEEQAADGSGQVTVLTVTNDGQPMDEDTLLNKLLTLGGSGKNFQGENTGGFGVAKSLLYLCHRSYSIHTGSIFLTGAGAQWEVGKAQEHLAGTRSTVFIDGCHAEALTAKVRRFASLCQWKGTLTVSSPASGESVLATDLHKGHRRKDLGWAIVYTNRSHANLCVVRINGQPMFTRPTRFAGTVLVELTGKADKVLTSNRDALTGRFEGELSEFLTAVAVDKRSALREQQAEYKRWHGEQLRAEAAKPKAAEGGLASVLDEQSLMALAALAGRAAGTDGSASGQQDGGISVRVVSAEEEQDRSITVGPQFIIKNTTGRKTPAACLPGESFSKVNRELVRAWTGLLLKLHQLTGLAGEFSVGFCLDEENEAEHEVGPFGRSYLLNPLTPVEVEDGKVKMVNRFTSAWADRFTLISLAAHEFVHGACGLAQHDEDYAGKLTEVMTVVTANLDQLTRICAPIQAVTVKPSPWGKR